MEISGVFQAAEIAIAKLLRQDTAECVQREKKYLDMAEIQGVKRRGV